MSPKKRRIRVAPGLEVIGLAIEPTRWVLLSTAIVPGVFRAADAKAIAQKTASFRGSDQTARDHAAVLEDIGLLKRTAAVGSGIAYTATPAGRLVHQHIQAAVFGGPPALVRSTAEARLLAIIARPNAETLDAFRLENVDEYELAATLQQIVGRQAVGMRARVTVEPEGCD